MDRKIPLEDIPLNSFHKKLTVYSSGGPFLDGYVLSVIGVVMLQMTNDLQLSALWQGLIAASALIGVFIGGFLGGWITDKLGRKVLYLIDLIAIIGFSVAQLWVESALMLFIWRLLLGIAVGADYPIATSFLTEFLPRKYRGILISVMIVIWFIGAASAYIVGEIAIRYAGDDAWRWILASAAVPGIFFLIARSGTPESPRWLLSKGRITEADQIVKRVYGSQYSYIDLKETHQSSGSKATVWSLFHSGYGKRMLFVCLFWTCSIIPIFAIYAFAPTVLKAMSLSDDQASFGAAAITVLFILGCVLVAFIINRVGRKKLLLHSFFWSGLALLLLGIYPDASANMIMLMFAGYAIAVGGSQVLQYLYPNELFPTEIRATAVGLGTSISRIGAAIGTYLVPLALTDLGISTTMLIAAGICWVGAVATWMLAPNIDAMSLGEAASLENEQSNVKKINITKRMKT
ncbi:MFS transporter [Acinetobacter pseudolwoffii]|uniref:MFS transporter n=1 Tax=Acinetobacter pseudolwoffii TaxID=2053287 RepID=UPI003989EEC5